MSELLKPVNPTEVLLALEIRAKEALDAFNAAKNLNLKQQYSNKKFKVPSDGGPYVSFTVNFGTQSEEINVVSDQRQAGQCVLKVFTRPGSGRLLSMDIMSYYSKYFDNTVWANQSLKVNSTALGTFPEQEGQYWTEKMYIYFDFIKRGQL